MAKLSTRGNYWILSWSGPDTDPRTGKPRRHRQSLGHVDALPRRDADACLRVKQYELSTGARLLNIHRRPAPRFDDFVKDYLLWHRMEYPAGHYRVEQIAYDHLKPRFGHTPLNLITPAEVERFKSERRFKAKASTVGKELRVLQAIINRAVALKIITDNPISIVRAPQLLDSKPHRFYEAAELATLYEKSGARAWIWKFLANTGLRRGEALMLRWLWITDTTVRVMSTEDARTKSAKWRELPLSDGARDALAGRAREVYVLPRMAPESLSRAFHDDAVRAGLDGSLHNLRHTYISHLVRNGVRLRTVQIYAGHAHYSTTEGYAYLDPGTAPEQALKLAI